jgi:hypothetical protein
MRVAWSPFVITPDLIFESGDGPQSTAYDMERENRFQEKL